MIWAFLFDIGFYVLLGLLTFVPVVLLVAASRRASFPEAREAVKEFLNSWASIAPKDMLDKVFNIAGVSTALFILGFSAYAFNRLGDASMPYTSSLLQHFGNKKVRWSIEHAKDDWRDVKFCFREVTGIRGDRLRWEATKAELGKFDVRFFRTTLYLFVLLLVASVVDLTNKKYRRRGYALLAVSLVGILMSQFLWVERQANYIENLVSRYESVYLNQHETLPWLPDSYPYKRDGDRDPPCMERGT